MIDMPKVINRTGDSSNDFLIKEGFTSVKYSEASIVFAGSGIGTLSALIFPGSTSSNS